MVKSIVFDAYGTLFDVYAVSTVSEKRFPGNGKIISRVWRQKQLEYTWLRSLMGRYADFEQVNQDALRFTLNKLGKSYTKTDLDVLLSSYLTLPPHPETGDALRALRSVRKMILSDGTEAMLLPLVDNARLTSCFDRILSVDTVKVYKPDPKVYEFAVSASKVSKEEILFVSSNGWDVAGSKSFGFKVAWVNRSKEPIEELGQHPDYIVSNLMELTRIID
ncbi:haloacid dehalogenase type II [Alicyclobacillus fastidiosus]|uniref:Haloacid dehalogenase type II n=1 Tax=Alicyclobacillus fastidiosus TaxID=392011 RepID=A0ABY6ZAV2_9BACL|nr:haloacid dehalogenase type II [Alicyclobacillus fastidiosus]WAH40009.1 haloacid dehalogenase type II [Alicyclobacillus fastidiosus]GMA61304.1 haloacid dehalogenase [Alicyclobacillus fastidiosus]